jgi:hypothetical protein
VRRIVCKPNSVRDAPDNVHLLSYVGAESSGRPVENFDRHKALDTLFLQSNGGKLSGITGMWLISD